MSTSLLETIIDARTLSADNAHVIRIGGKPALYVAVDGIRDERGAQITKEFKHAKRFDVDTATTVARGLHKATVVAVLNVPLAERGELDEPAARSSNDAATMVPGETDPTTRTALAEFYDARRDKNVEILRNIVAAYGAELEKRGAGFTDAHAGPMLSEMRKQLDAADAAQKRAREHRSAAK